MQSTTSAQQDAGSATCRLVQLHGNIGLELALSHCCLCAGLFAKTYEGYPKWLYGTSYYNDKLMLAAGWLFRATGAQGSA